MAAPKPFVRRDSRQMSAAPRRPESHVRFRSPGERMDQGDSGAPPPSTLPPAPFAHEEEVRALEWWLDAHMGLVSDLAWLEQVLDFGPGGAHSDAVRRLVVQAEGVRDALYELYCDATDERLSTLLGDRGSLEAHVRGSYAWCARVVSLLGTIVSGLRTEDGPDWASAKASFRDAVGEYVVPSCTLRVEVSELPIDTTSPVEPLRKLPQDIETLFAATEELQAALAKRFG
jgi:hypothetical protein